MNEAQAPQESLGASGRIIAELSGAMFQLIEEMPFERIKVNALCSKTGYSRATFYNYFNDKDDLLNYCWSVMSNELDIKSYTGKQGGYHSFFDRLADLFDQHRTSFDNVLRHNKEDGALVQSLEAFMRRRLSGIISTYQCFHINLSRSDTSLPIEVVTDYCCNSLMFIEKWALFNLHPITREQAHDLIDKLLYSDNL